MKDFFIPDNIEFGRFETDFYYYKNKEIGDFILSENAFLEIQNNFRIYGKNFFTGCASATAKNRRDGITTLWLTDRSETVPSKLKEYKCHYFQDYLNYSIQHSVKITSLIDSLALKATRQPFEKNKLTIADIRIAEIVDDAELVTWLSEMLSCGYITEDSDEFIYTIRLRDMTVTPFTHYFRLTPKSWAAIESRKRGLNSNKAFIAMSFKIEQRKEIQSAIESACSKSSIIAATVDQEHYTGKITDKIIAMINESVIVVADFTSNNNGVYFEAGYAEGLNKIVIYTIKKSDLDHLHFDTKQTNYIAWETPTELEAMLGDRVKVLIEKKNRL